MDLNFVATRTSKTCPNTCASVPNIFLKISNSSTTLIPSWECNNQFYVKTKRCTYGLKQIDMLVYKQLARNLSHNKLYQKYKKSWRTKCEHILSAWDPCSTCGIWSEASIHTHLIHIILIYIQLLSLVVTFTSAWYYHIKSVYQTHRFKLLQGGSDYIDRRT